MIEPHETFQFPCTNTNHIDLSLDAHEYANYSLGNMDAYSNQFDNFSPPSTELFADFPQVNLDNRSNPNAALQLNDQQYLLDTEELKLILQGKIVDVSEWVNRNDGENPTSLQIGCGVRKANNAGPGHNKCNPSTPSPEPGIFPHQLILPGEDMETNHQLSVNNLVKAYVEAMENKQSELAEVIMVRIGEKVSPAGDSGERLLYYSFQPILDKQAEYLKQESARNFDKALETFYRMFPSGMVAHFTANNAILESRPHDHDTEVLHVVDFDMGEGVQWSSMIMALGLQQQQQYYGHTSHSPQQQVITTLKLTAIKWKEEEFCGYMPAWKRFEATKRRLQDYAKSFGLVVQVEEMEMHEVVSELRRSTWRSKEMNGDHHQNMMRREWMAFNCMWALPHMGRRRSRGEVMEFLKVAKDLLLYNNINTNTGIVTFGDGGAWEMHHTCRNNGFGLFFKGYMEHYLALLESIEWGLPGRLGQARIAMECLFVAPYVSSLAWMQSWKEIKEENWCDDLKGGFGFQGLRVNNEWVLEAKEMVRQGETPYAVGLEGESHNQLVLLWRATPLVKVSAWR